MAHLVDIGAFIVGQGQRPFLIAGPCVIESEQLVLETAGRIAEITRSLGMPYVFKSSFDKANRTSISSFRGPGLTQGLEVLAKVKRADIHRWSFSRSALSDAICQGDRVDQR